MLALLESAIVPTNHLLATGRANNRYIYMENFRAAVSTMLGILLGFHLNRGLVSSLINYCRKTVLAGVPFIFYQAHDAGLVPAGNAGLILDIFII